MSLWWLVVLIPLPVWLVGYLRRRRHPLVDQSGIRYHFRSNVARIAARLRRSPNNYAVTVGRHTFVRMDYIRAEHAAHEWCHARQAERMGPTLFVLYALAQYARFGYVNSPIEKQARFFASDTTQHFVERRP